MTEPFTIREATPADLAIIVTHRRKMFEDIGHDRAIIAAAVPHYTRWTKEHLENGSYLGWLAVASGGKVIAGAGLWLMDAPPGSFDSSLYRGYLLNVYTDPDYRKRGLARQLVQVVVDWCATNGVRTISLHASPQGQPMYEGMGFKATNEMRFVLPEKIVETTKDL
jgi:GNAT superfamily N-acetyltransferase